MSENISKNKDKKIVIAIFSLIILLAGVAGFLVFNKLSKEPEEIIAKAENNYEKEYHSFCTLEHDANISIDGVLDEEVWQGKNWFSNTFITNHNANMPVMKVTGFTTEYGVYIASVVEDENIVNNGQRSSGYNSMFEFEVTADNVGEYRVNDGLYRTKYIIDMRADCISRDSNVDRAVVVDGELNSGQTKSATLELFIPWKNLMIDTSKGVPEEFRVLPSYRAVLLGDDKTTMILPVVYTTVNTRDFYRFGASGYMTPDREGAIVGNTKFGNEKTGNWDVSKEEQGIVRSSYGSEHHKIFFTEEHGSNFIVKTTIVPGKALDNGVPRAGIYFHGTDTIYNTIYHSVFLNMHENNLVNGKNGTKNFAKYQLITLNNVDNKWNEKSLLETYQIENSKASTREGVELTVVKYNDKFWYFADGEFLTQEINEFIEDDVIPGFYALGGDAIFKDYSCEAVDSDEIKTYLEKEGLYLIDAKTKGKQGSVTPSAPSVKKGGSYEITIKSKSGYRVSSVIINGKEMIEDVRKNANGGVYTVKNVRDHQEVVVSYEKITDGVKFSGKVTDGEKAITADVAIRGISDKSLYYFATSSGEKGFNVTLPKGTYKIIVTATDYKAVVEESVTISKDRDKTYKLTLSDFPTMVEVNGKKLGSNRSVWDISNEYKGIITGSFEKGTKHKPLYFRQTAKDFVVEFTAKYTTAFVEGGSYQPDLMAGLMFHDGTNEGWIYARTNGLVTTDWDITTGLIDESVLTYPDKKPVKFGLAKKGNEVYVYLNGEFAYKMDWSRIAPNISANSEVAIGLMMLADKTADIEFSNYKLSVGTQVADKYIKDRILLDEPIDGSSVLAKRVTVNGVQLKSMLAKWDLSEVSKNIVKGSYAMGSKLQPLYFTKAGSNALISAKFEYTTDLTDKTKKELESYQPDLMGGFTFSDGTNMAHIVAASKGIIIVNPEWKFKQGLISDPILHRDYGQKPVEMSVALKNDNFYVFLDEQLVATLPLKEVLPNATSSNLAMGITMIADKNADIRVSNISQTTDANSINEYIRVNTQPEKPIDGSALFAKYLTVNGVKLNSSVDKWDLSEISNDVVKGSTEMGSSYAPLYFLKAGNTALMSVKIEYTTDLTNVTDLKPYERILGGGFIFNDGKDDNTILTYGNKLVNTSPWKVSSETIISDSSKWVLMTDNKLQNSVEMTVALKDNMFYVYYNNELVKTYALKDVLPNTAENTELAMGITMAAFDKRIADVKYSNISYTTDEAVVEEYMKRVAETDKLIEGSTLLAQKVKVNDVQLKSEVSKWDLSEISNNVVKGSTAMGSSLQPLYFIKTGSSALINAKFEYTTEFAQDVTYQRALGGGFVISDGTNTAYVLAYGTGLIIKNSANSWNDTYYGLLERGKAVLMSDIGPKTPVELTAAISNSFLHMYFDGVMLAKIPMSEVLPNTTGGNFAIGITMMAEQTADIRISNLNMTTDATEVENYIKDDTLLFGTPFAKSVTVNNVKLNSVMNKWDLSEVSQNVVKGSFAMGSKLQPLYFVKTGETVLMSTKLEYTTDLTDKTAQEKEEYQKDLMGGFTLSDGTNTTHMLAWSSGLQIIKNNVWSGYSGLLDHLVLRWDYNNQCPVRMTVTIKGTTVNVYLDNALVKTFTLSELGMNVTSAKDVATGIVMVTDKLADIKFSEITHTTDATVVDTYLNSTLFTGKNSVTVNGKTVSSAIANWDFSKLSQSIVEGTSPTNRNSPIYLAKTGKSVLVSATIEYTSEIAETEKADYQEILKAGYMLHDGTDSAYIMARGTGYEAHAFKTNQKKADAYGKIDYVALNRDHGQRSVKLTLALKDNVVKVYMNDNLVGSHTLADLGLTNNADVAMGLYIYTDYVASTGGKKADMRYSNIVHTTDVTEVDAYINAH